MGKEFKEKPQVTVEWTDYTSAIKEFVSFTNHHPEFFTWSQEKQQQKALEYIQKHKKKKQSF